jgi:hypothetical protein
MAPRRTKTSRSKSRTTRKKVSKEELVKVLAQLRKIFAVKSK